MTPEDKKHALKTAKKFGWGNTPVPQSALKVIVMKRPMQRKWTNDRIKDFGKERYGRKRGFVWLSKRHYLERERQRSVNIDSDVELS